MSLLSLQPITLQPFNLSPYSQGATVEIIMCVTSGVIAKVAVS